MLRKSDASLHIDGRDTGGGAAKLQRIAKAGKDTRLGGWKDYVYTFRFRKRIRIVLYTALHNPGGRPSDQGFYLG